MSGYGKRIDFSCGNDLENTNMEVQEGWEYNIGLDLEEMVAR